MDAATARLPGSGLPEARCGAPGPSGGTGPPPHPLGQSGETPGPAYDRRTVAAEGRTAADPPSHQGCAISSVRLRPPALRGELRDRHEGGHRLHHLLWRLGPGVRVCSSAILGGGIGVRAWILNAQVPGGYPRLDPDRHLAEIAAAEGLTGPGAGLMTAADVAAYTTGQDGGVTATVTAGLGVRGWAAAPDTATRAPRPPETEASAVPFPPGPAEVPAAPFRPGTVNIVVTLPVALSDAALVNAVATATEAKVQALLDAGLDCSGTPTDAVCVAAPEPGPDGGEPFAGPRSTWGARIARAVHTAVLAGARTAP